MFLYFPDGTVLQGFPPLSIRRIFVYANIANRLIDLLLAYSTKPFLSLDEMIIRGKGMMILRRKMITTRKMMIMAKKMIRIIA